MLWKRGTLVLLLAALAVVGPIVAYAGLTVIYPKSTQTLDIDTTPPVIFQQGSDYAIAANNDFATLFAEIDNKAAHTITLKGLSGGNVTIDNYTAILNNLTGSADFKVQIATAYDGTGGLDGGAELLSLRVRLWVSQLGAAPTSDASPSVCAVLNLEAPINTESATSCNRKFINVQVVYDLASGATGTGSVSIRPSSLTFA